MPHKDPEELRKYRERIAKEPWRKQQLREAQARYRQKKLAENPNFYHDYYLKHKERRQEYERRNKDRIKTEVLTYYGGGKLACARCGEERLPCLSIDHLDNKGTKHRRELGKAGLGFYYWLKSQGYPSGYQTLCMNCQFVKKEEVFLAELERRKGLS